MTPSSERQEDEAMSEQEHTEFLKSLQLARSALYARDPKRRAIEEVERTMRAAEHPKVRPARS